MEKDGKFSLDLAAKTLDFFGKEFGSPYPLPKMDMVLHEIAFTYGRSLFQISQLEQWRYPPLNKRILIIELGTCYLPYRGSPL